MTVMFICIPINHTIKVFNTCTCHFLLIWHTSLLICKYMTILEYVDQFTFDMFVIIAIWLTQKLPSKPIGYLFGPIIYRLHFNRLCRYLCFHPLSAQEKVSFVRSFVRLCEWVCVNWMRLVSKTSSNHNRVIYTSGSKRANESITLNANLDWCLEIVSVIE